MRRMLIILGTLLITVLLVLGGCTSVPASTEVLEASLTATRLLTPHNGATDIQLSPTLLWQPVTNAGGYELWISLNYDFSDIVHSVSCRLTAYQPSEDLNPSTQYYWMVAAKMEPADPDSPVAYSEVWTFTTTPTSAQAPPQTAGIPISRSRDKVFLKITERVQNLAQTYEAKEYVALLFPPFSTKGEYDDDLRAWIITITTFPSEAFEGFESAEWFDGDVDEHFSSFREPTWVVYDDGRILPMGGAFMIEADIEQLNTNRILK